LDSGIFAGIEITPAEILAYAEGVNASFVFAPDVFGDPEATLQQAEETWIEYARWRQYYNNFALVGVAQGTTPREYLACARELAALGYTHLAVGGLLREVPTEKSRGWASTSN
jgi:queuine/archaeosine tRNA-ribosyltransferase